MLIGLSGKLGSGKSEVAKILRAELLPDIYETKKFAHILKAMTATLLDCSFEELESQEYKSTPLEWLGGVTPRTILQKIGTEFGREMIHPDIWVNALLKDYSPGDNWIVDDVRFPNEAKAISAHGGVLIRINRDGGESEHPSETALDHYIGWDTVIDNIGSLDELIWEVQSLARELKKQYAGNR